TTECNWPGVGTCLSSVSAVGTVASTTSTWFAAPDTMNSTVPCTSTATPLYDDPLPRSRGALGTLTSTTSSVSPSITYARPPFSATDVAAVVAYAPTITGFVGVATLITRSAFPSATYAYPFATAKLFAVPPVVRFAT